MKHEKAERLLADYAVGRLKGRRKIEIEGHISECPICESELKALQQTEKLLRKVGTIRPSNPHFLLAQIREATQKVHEPSRRILNWQLPQRWFLKPAIGFAIFLLIAAGALIFWYQTSKQPNLTIGYEQYHRLVSWGNPLGNWIELGIGEVSAMQ